jgi:hypothetical protein
MTTMTKMNKLTLAALALAMLSLNAAACPQKVPAGLEASTVAEDVVIDNLQLSMLLVHGREKKNAILARVAKEWVEAGYKVKRNEAAGWDVLSALSDTCMTTLQLGDRPDAFGYLAVNKLKKAVRVSRADMPVPPGGRVTSAVDSKDDGRRGTIMSIEASMPLMAANEFYMRRLTEEKWSGVRSHVTMDANKQPKYAVVNAQKGRDLIEVVIWRDQETQVVINRAETL